MGQRKQSEARTPSAPTLRSKSSCACFPSHADTRTLAHTGGLLEEAPLSLGPRQNWVPQGQEEDRDGVQGPQGLEGAHHSAYPDGASMWSEAPAEHIPGHPGVEPGPGRDPMQKLMLRAVKQLSQGHTAWIRTCCESS